ncbi:MarR family winged helix-turn-helix transcriptional regulator [Paenibacillus sp. NPDC058071]|uniref:MarR family winged helix-turn-helix transcriptional regulator n=1 Tax=Paenibacillus sp. NPDC058071 TaxID=3346326 RepID=UPI0036DCDC06
MIEDEIREKLDKIGARMRRDYSNALREFNLHVGQDNLLCRLWKGEGVTQLQLCEHLKCEPSTVTNMLNTLERNNYVYRQRDPADARVSRVYLTEQGKEIQEPIRKIWRDEQDKLLRGFLPEDRLLLSRLLSQIEENLS